MKFLLLCLAGWINREQQAVIEYLQEEVRVLKQIHGKRPTFNDDQRRRLATREVQVTGIARLANRLWMEQIARNVTDGIDGFLKSYKYFIHDRDPLFTAEFRRNTILTTSMWNRFSCPGALTISMPSRSVFWIDKTGVSEPNDFLQREIPSIRNRSIS